MPSPVVLVVDDSDDHRFITATALRRTKSISPFVVEEAPGGPQAVERLGQLTRLNQPILVLSDYLMPYMDGLELLHAIRKKWGRDKVRVVIYSSTDQGVAKESRAAGADEFMVKPMDLNEFRQELARLVESWLTSTPDAASPKRR